MAASAAGTIPTENASRYLQQLCKHWSHKLEVSFTPQEGRVAFQNGAVATFQAWPETLDLAIEAPDAATLETLKGVVMNHLDRFAFREAPLAVSWNG